MTSEIKKKGEGYMPDQIAGGNGSATGVEKKYKREEEGGKKQGNLGRSPDSSGKLG